MGELAEIVLDSFNIILVNTILFNIILVKSNNNFLSQHPPPQHLTLQHYPHQHHPHQYNTKYQTHQDEPNHPTSWSLGSSQRLSDKSKDQTKILPFHIRTWRPKPFKIPGIFVSKVYVQTWLKTLLTVVKLS